MSVFTTFRLDVRPYSGYNDPSLPIAAWIAQGSLVGDASGGTLTFAFRIQTDGDPQISELYNLEALQYDTSNEAIQDVILSTRNMDSLSSFRAVFDQRWVFQTEGAAATNRSAGRLDRGTILPLWFGSPNRDEGDADIRLETVNNDLRLYLATLQGYMWGPRSVLAEGGPRRPVGGLFGA